MKKMKNHIQVVLCGLAVGGMLLTTPAVYAAVPEGTTQQAEQMITVSGVAYDAATRAPLAGVRVVAHGNSKFSAMTNETGSYSLQVPSYVTLLDFEAPGYNRVQMAANEKVREVFMHSETFSKDYSAWW